MLAKIITSALSGLLLPWAYFLMVDITPMNLFKDGVLISQAVHKSELELFIEFYGFKNALLLYLKSVIVCFVCAYAICVAHNFFAKKLSENL